jgi:7-carboxy-7-deazaguanine synthase
MTDTMEIAETFLSLQGESSYAGRPCFFIRTAGCNLRCRYCDASYARSGGRSISVPALVAEYRASGVPLVEITGGEPLLQSALPALAGRLAAVPGATVLVETNGSLDISAIPLPAVAIMDLKCPGSGETERMDWGNIARLRPHDEVKFVVGDRLDYEWARSALRQHELAGRCHAVHLSPVWGVLSPDELGRWIVEDRLPARLQIQLHKLLSMR